MTIQSKRLRLRSFAERHLQKPYISWLNDPLLMRYSEQRFRKHTLKTCRQYMKSFEGTLNYFWAIEENESGSHIGSLNAYLDTHNEIADLGLLVGASSAFGKGLGTEAWMAACDFLFRYRNVRKVTAGTLSVNIGMIRVCEKSGMQIDGRRSGQAILDGQEVDMVYYASFRRLWLDKYTKPLIAVIP